MAQAPKSKADTARKRSAMAEKMGVTVPAAWPTGLSQVTQAYEACRRSEAYEVCADWLKRAPRFHPIAARVLPQRSRIHRRLKKKPRQ